MADNVAITAGSGTSIAADEVVDGTLGTVKVQYVKIMDGTLDGTTKVATGSGTGNGMRVVVDSSQLASLLTSQGAFSAGAQQVSLPSDHPPLHHGDLEVSTTLPVGMTSLRDGLVAQRYTVWSDSIADGLSTGWTQTTANGGTITVTGGEGLLKTSTATNGSSQLVGPNVTYLPGQVAWMNSAIRFGDTGTAGDIRRIGMFTVSGTTPQDGYYFELSGTTLNAVTVKGGSATATASTSWTKFSTQPFTLDTNYHSFEIRFTANSALFYIDNILRHSVSGTSAPITSSLTLPITLTNVKTSGATDITFAVRNIGAGRFGTPDINKGLSNRAFSATFSTLTRPANTTAYSAADSISDNATAGSVTALSATVSDTADDPVFISEIVVDSTDTGLAGKKIRAYLYNSDPTANTGVGGGDNAAFANKKAGYLGSFMGWMETGFSDGTVGRLVPCFNETNFTQAGGFIVAPPTTGARTLYIQYQAVEAFTPSANSTTIIGKARGWQGRAA